MTQSKLEELQEKERRLERAHELREQLQKLKYRQAQYDQDISVEQLKLTHYMKQMKILKITMIFCLIALVLMTLIPSRNENNNKEEKVQEVVKIVYVERNNT